MSSTREPEPLFRPLAPDDPRRLGDFQLRARLGAGGMGRVYLGATSTGRRLAVKVVRTEFAEDPEFRIRFRREIEAAQRVRGPFTAAVVDADAEGDRPWLATEYIPGPSLAAAVAGHGPLPEETVRVLVAGIAEALHAVHRAGLVHRDLKPSNVLLGPEGPCVIDFGIARAADATPLTRTGYQLGTPVFMSPEQVRGDPASAAADVWAVGALAFYAATGEKPFGDGPDTAVLYRVVHEDPRLDLCPGYIRGLVTACLDKDPARRPSLPSILERFPAPPRGEGWLPEPLGQVAAQYADTPPGPVVVPVMPRYAAMPPPSTPPVAAPVSTPPSAPAGPTVAPPTRPVPRRRALLAALVSFALVVVAGGAVVLLLNRSHDDAGGGNASTPPASASSSGTSGGAPAPGTYRINRQVVDTGDWQLVLTDIVVAHGTMTVHVDYRNKSASIPQLGCLTADVDTIEYADGSTVQSTETSCSKHPGKTWTVPQGKSWTGYAVFPAPTSGQSFTLHWQPDDVPSGDVTGITLR